MYMGEFVNTHSAAIIGVLFLLIVGLLAWDYRRRPRVLVAIAFVSIVLFAGYWTSRHGPSDVGTIAGVDAVLASGQPVVLELYSDT